MPLPAILVESISKRYHIGARAGGGHWGDAFRAAVLGPLDRVRRFGRSSHGEEDAIWALKDVSFEVQPGEVLGLIGANGAGKSTLLKVLARITDPTEGRAVLGGRVASLLEVGTGFHPELTGRENVYLGGAILGMRKAEIDARFDEIVAFSGVERFIDTPIKRYSSGMAVRLGFAVAAHLEPEILLVDEVLAVGDAAFQQKCLGKLESLEHSGRTIIFVSHNMAAIRHLCTSCLWLEGGRVAAGGEADQVVERYLQSATAQEGAQGQRWTFDVEPPSPRPEAWVTRVELLAADGAPLSRLSTNDACRARVSFHCASAGNYGIYFGIQSDDGAQLIGYETNNPDGIVLECEPGEHSVEVDFPALPLAAGTYWAGAGVTFPSQQWLHRVHRAGRFEVQGSDVYGTGWPVTTRLSLLCIPHTWHVAGSDDGIRVVQ